MKGGEVVVIDVEKDKVVTRIKVGTGSDGSEGSTGGSATGLASLPFWWFEH